MLSRKNKQFQIPMDEEEKRLMEKAVQEKHQMIDDLFDGKNGIDVELSKDVTLFGDPIINGATLHLHGVIYKMVLPSLYEENFKKLSKNPTKDTHFKYMVVRIVLGSSSFYSTVLSNKSFKNVKGERLSVKNLLRQFKIIAAQDYRDSCRLQLSKQYSINNRYNINNAKKKRRKI